MKVLLFGTFDHFHPGHEFVIGEALKRGEVTVVIARDHNVHRIKGLTAMQSETERRDTVQKAFPQVHAVLGDEADFLAPVRAAKPDLILLGYDQKLPPGVTETDLPYLIERLPPYRPEEFKSSIMRKRA